MRKGTLTADWVKKWGLHEKSKNLPYKKRTPKNLEYLYRYDIESVYVTPRGNLQPPKAYKRRPQTLKLKSLQVTSGHPEMGVARLWPNRDWRRIWKNLNEAPLPEAMRVTWYLVIHKIIPTNQLLYLLKMVQKYTYLHFAAMHTLEHRLIVCGERKSIWKLFKTLMARMLRKTATWVPHDWIMHPQFHIWPPSDIMLYCGL